MHEVYTFSTRPLNRTVYRFLGKLFLEINFSAFKKEVKQNELLTFIKSLIFFFIMNVFVCYFYILNCTLTITLNNNLNHIHCIFELKPKSF